MELGICPGLAGTSARKRADPRTRGDRTRLGGKQTHQAQTDGKQTHQGQNRLDGKQTHQGQNRLDGKQTHQGQNRLDGKQTRLSEGRTRRESADLAGCGGLMTRGSGARLIVTGGWGRANLT
jgi:hypothetical protein